MDIFLDKIVETLRAGIFKFQVGLDSNNSDFHLLLQRVIDAQNRFISSPLSSIATQLEGEVIVSFVFGTDTIEGCSLSESETAVALELSPKEVQTTQEQRVINIKNSYDYIKSKAMEKNWQLEMGDVLQIHRLIRIN